MSIKENIKLAKPEATDEEIIEVCKKSQIHDDIMAMKDAYNTLVGENGVILSGGQKQRIAIARALIRKSKIILLEMSTGDFVSNAYVRFEVLGRKGIIIYSSLHNKFLFDLEDDFS